MPTDLILPSLPPPPFDAEEALVGVRLAAVRLGAHLVTLVAELTRDALIDADRHRDRSMLPRIALLEEALDVAEASATDLCVELATLAPRQSAVELVRIVAVKVEAMLVLFSRELCRAPWGTSDGRVGVLSELAAAAQDAARLVRVGLSTIAEQLARKH